MKTGLHVLEEDTYPEEVIRHRSDCPFLYSYIKLEEDNNSCKYKVDDGQGTAFSLEIIDCECVTKTNDELMPESNNPNPPF